MHRTVAAALLALTCACVDTTPPAPGLGRVKQADSVARCPSTGTPNWCGSAGGHFCSTVTGCTDRDDTNGAICCPCTDDNPLGCGVSACAQCLRPAGSHASASCTAGSCGCTCDSGWQDNDNDSCNGCPLQCNNANACGAACTDCPSPPNNSHAQRLCAGGTTCGCACDSGWTDDNGDHCDGCPTQCTTTSACGLGCTPCTGGTNSTPDCSSGSCQCTCDPGWGTLLPGGNPCGGCLAPCITALACGQTCAFCPIATGLHGIAVCSGGTTCGCDCLPAWTDNDNDPCNGCPTQCNTIAACGSSCQACASPSGAHATATCSGSCGCACDPGWKDTNSNACDGCPTQCNTVAACGSTCQGCASPTGANAHGVCTGGTTCGCACDTGFIDTDSDPCNGCPSGCSTTASCGPTCAPCAAPPVGSHAHALCTGGACSCVCDSGFKDSDADACNGCPTPCTTAATCGSDCGACQANHASGLGCSINNIPASQACTFTCDPGWRDEDGNKQNACEAECKTPASCGAGCQPCGALPSHASQVTCSGSSATSSCGITCAVGYLDSNTTFADGCEACAPGYYAAQATPLTCSACSVGAHCGASCTDCSNPPSDDGFGCVAGVCGCAGPADCPAGRACVGSRCVSTCTSTAQCSGGQTCCGPTGQKQCVSQGPELCDGKDNDCNGTADDGIDPSQLPLCARTEGVCAGTRQDCTSGRPQACPDSKYGANYQAVETYCDGLDNDCDGTADNLAPGSLAACPLQAGVCQGSSKTCVAGQVIDCGAAGYAAWATAHGGTYEETETLCDGKDNDCNGQVDEPAACQAGPDAGEVIAPVRQVYDVGGCGCSQAGAATALGGLALLLGMTRRPRPRNG